MVNHYVRGVKDKARVVVLYEEIKRESKGCEIINAIDENKIFEVIRVAGAIVSYIISQN